MRYFNTNIMTFSLGYVLLCSVPGNNSVKKTQSFLSLDEFYRCLGDEKGEVFRQKEVKEEKTNSHVLLLVQNRTKHKKKQTEICRRLTNFCVCFFSVLYLLFCNQTKVKTLIFYTENGLVYVMDAYIFSYSLCVTKDG